MLVCFPVVTITIVVWLSAVGGLLNTLLNLDNRETKEKLKSWTQGLGKVFLGLIAVAFIVIPIVAWVPRQVTSFLVDADGRLVLGKVLKSPGTISFDILATALIPESEWMVD